MDRTLDVICLGRAAVDLYGQQLGGRLEDVQSFAKYLGGSSGNLAAGLARLGARSAMLTRVGDEHMGRFVREALAREGVDVSHVGTDPDRLTALVVLGISGGDSFPHIFFRENCADMAIEAADVDEEFIASSRALSITGTHLSTERTYDAVARAVAFAARHGTKLILDIDYRPVLWGLVAPGNGEARFASSEVVTERIQSLISHFDLIVGTEEEIQIAGGASDVREALGNIRQLTDASIVMKRGELGCVIFADEIPASSDDDTVVAGTAVEVLNVLGAGDAFLSGFLHAWLDGRTLAECARIGNACGALVVSRHGCTPAMPTRPELDDYLQRMAELRRPDLDDRIVYLHEATTRTATPENLCVLAFDHRRQLEEMLPSSENRADRIRAFKQIISEAVISVSAELSDDITPGVIVDDRYGERVLSRLGPASCWIGRPVEVPGSRPVELTARNGTGRPLLEWPATHVVKCLVFYHPDDDIDLRLKQERLIGELYADCTALGRELLLEAIVTSGGHAVDDETVANVMRRFYHLGIRPAWWKLEAQTVPGWEAIGQVLEDFDPLCRGVLILGLGAPGAELKESFQTASRYDFCRGFAVGRSIFEECARLWFDGEISDEAAIDRVADKYREMIGFWRAAIGSGRGRQAVG